MSKSGVIVLSIILTAVIAISGTYAYMQNKANREKTDLETQLATLQSSATATTSATIPTTADKTADWKTYTNEEYGFSFKYPEDWVIEEDTSLERIYVKNMEGDYNKSNMPTDFQKVWISYSQSQSSPTEENLTKDGKPSCCEATTVSTSTISANVLDINTYEFNTIGGPTLEAYWSDNSGRRYSAKNGSEKPAGVQEKEITTLKQILSTFQFTK
jgi:type II secretory pathway pseudopilin PulG